MALSDRGCRATPWARASSNRRAEGLQNASVRIRDCHGYAWWRCAPMFRPRVLDEPGVGGGAVRVLSRFPVRTNRAIFVSSPADHGQRGRCSAGAAAADIPDRSAALSNVARHSKASAVRVFLSTFEDELRLGIEDDGVGFDVDRWRQRRATAKAAAWG